MKKTILLTLILATNVAFAAPRIPKEHQVGKLEVVEITPEFQKNYVVAPSILEPADPIEKIGKVIAIGKDIVALGEAIYELVKKGAPVNQTEYAPVSVVPRDPATREAIDPFELEGFSLPVERVFRANIKDGMGQSIVGFTYKVMYSYGGSYNGTGKYLTAVQIVPSAITTKFGWSFSATMKVSGIMNHGTKADPVAGVLVALKYKLNGWNRAEERNDTIHVSGNGGLKSYGIQ
jgi:hypothetical protein